MIKMTFMQWARVIALIFFLCNASSVVAATITVSATVPSTPSTIVVFSGIAYPGATVTILQDGSAFATTTANTSARFSSSTGSVSAGAHTYTLTAVDSLNRNSKTYQVALNITEGTTTTVSNIFFGPTIVLSSTSIAEGDSVTVSGITSPSSSVTIEFISGSTLSYTAVANSSGVWSRTFSSELTEGVYTVRARATDPDTSVSEWSTTLTLTVGAPSDICVGKNMADINCDGNVNTTDLSILLSFWQQTDPGNTRTDINGDTIVDLIDFSIMMYYWTGP